MKQMSYGRRLWYVWGPVIIKIAIGWLISGIVITAFLTIYLMKETGGDTAAMMELTNNEAAMEEIQEVVSEQIIGLEVPIGMTAVLLTLPVLAGFLFFDRRKGKPTALVRKKAHLWQYVAVIGIAVSMCLCLNNLITLAHLSSLSESYEAVTEAFYSPPFWMQVLYLGILSPVCEELTFRGLMFRRMRTGTPFLSAALYSSFVFALIHGNLVQIPYAFIMGMMFAYVYEKYGSLKAPCIAHMAANLFSVTATQFGWMDKIFENPMQMGVLTVACAACASTMYVLMQRIEAGSFDLVAEDMNDNNENNDKWENLTV